MNHHQKIFDGEVDLGREFDTKIVPKCGRGGGCGDAAAAGYKQLGSCAAENVKYKAL
jgi:hypothetical protein